MTFCLFRNRNISGKKYLYFAFLCHTNSLTLCPGLGVTQRAHWYEIVIIEQFYSYFLNMFYNIQKTLSSDITFFSITLSIGVISTNFLIPWLFITFGRTMTGHIVIIEIRHCQAVCEQLQKNQQKERDLYECIWTSELLQAYGKMGTQIFKGPYCQSRSVRGP